MRECVPVSRRFNPDTFFFDDGKDDERPSVGASASSNVQFWNALKPRGVLH